ncbi:hypothetical protein THRCLA_09626 [Thraustotheca clavata]|uniref:Acyltransferase n=1 Tax=Thraustotheca clavata TaxID=74557 RepID=A0A1V9YVE4_9STRA|nr:hypothetical protein THRCLA_09626 [Thraustotheca clavata]
MPTSSSEYSIFLFAYKYLFPVYTYLYDWSKQNIPKEGRILYVGYHSIHAHDLLPMAFSIYKVTGKLPRGLIHYAAMIVYGPLFRRLGCVAGSQESGIQAFKDGFHCICTPGGIEEAMQGFESSYKLIWKSSSGNERRGFAKLAREANATIVPFVTRNGEEMVFSPIGYLWNIVGLSRLYEQVLNLPEPFRIVLLHIKMLVYFFAWTLMSIPVPVRAGVVFGKPIVPKKNESEIDFAERTKYQVQELINQVNPGGHCYSRGLNDRFQS